MNYISTMQFIELFRKHSALWDRHDVNYLNKVERMRQREQIGLAMGMTEVDVGKKICNLRTYYLREMVKRDKALEYGQETAETYTPKWPYFDALDTFLQDVVRKKRNEYLTAGGPFQELPYVYSVDDHLSDNDVTEDFPNDSNELSRDSHRAAAGVGGGEGEPRKAFYITTNDVHAYNNNDSDSDHMSPPKRPKLEPEEDYLLAAAAAAAVASRHADGEDGHLGGDPDSRATGSSETLGSGVPNIHRSSSSSFRAMSSLLPNTPSLGGGGGGGTQINASLHRLPTMARGPASASSSSSTQGLGMACSNSGFGGMMDGGRMNGHSLGGGGGGSGGGGGTMGGIPGHHHLHHPHPPGGSPKGMMMMMEEDEDWLFGRYIAAELKKVKSFKDKQLTKMKIQQIVTYAQLGMSPEQASSSCVGDSGGVGGGGGGGGGDDDDGDA